MKTSLILLLACVFHVLAARDVSAQYVLTGLDQVEEFVALFKHKRLGLITNHTAYNRHDRHIVDVFLAPPDVQVTALFGPEHGLRGSEEAGAKIDSSSDPINKIPIYSLYGKTTKPTQEMLSNVDILVFDIQDVGARFYTYTSTLALCMEAAAETGKKFVVLDRPNPINGIDVEGNILEMEFSTFVGLFPIPVRHGLTTGELAQMFNEEGWLKNGVKANLTVIPVKGWNRKMWFDQTGLKFRAPSPNIPDLETAVVYPGLCLLEGANISEGRGTLQPFRQFGAPWINAGQLTDQLNQLNLAGIKFQEHRFTPVTIEGMATHPKYEGRECHGVKIEITDRRIFSSYISGVKIIDAIYRLYPDSLEWRVSHFDRLCGSAKVRQTIVAHGNLDSLQKNWQPALEQFLQIRKKYILYE